MTRLASRFGAANLIRRDRPLTREELFRVVPSVFSEDKHESRSERYTYIPTISLLDSLQREGFQPFFACQTRVRDPGRREHTKHMLRLRREGQITGKQVPEIILLNSMMAPVRTRCCRVYFVRFVRTGSSAVSRLARCGAAQGGCSESGD
jgi:hypothetical protein